MPSRLWKLPPFLCSWSPSTFQAGNSQLVFLMTPCPGSWLSGLPPPHSRTLGILWAPPDNLRSAVNSLNSPLPCNWPIPGPQVAEDMGTARGIILPPSLGPRDSCPSTCSAHPHWEHTPVKCQHPHLPPIRLAGLPGHLCAARAWGPGVLRKDSTLSHTPGSSSP